MLCLSPQMVKRSQTGSHRTTVHTKRPDHVGPSPFTVLIKCDKLTWTGSETVFKSID
uniref:Uncharacterized protein n=1 Tax=Rhizophagus irregularis (strain DAOM 181602 / DAOM 197198 / MUCL 43194) TaxID=747089 RepID=U9U012_RHIID